MQKYCKNYSMILGSNHSKTFDKILVNYNILAKLI